MNGKLERMCKEGHGLIKVPAHSFLGGLRKAMTSTGINGDIL
jgi:hypothetical protein